MATKSGQVISIGREFNCPRWKNQYTQKGMTGVVYDQEIFTCGNVVTRVLSLLLLYFEVTFANAESHDIRVNNKIALTKLATCNI